MQLRFQGITVIKGKDATQVMTQSMDKLNALHKQKQMMVSAFLPGKKKFECIILHGKDNTNFWVEQGLDTKSPLSGLDAIELQDQPNFIDRIKAYVKKYAKKDITGQPPEIIRVKKQP